jgi:hypothetical protein
VPACAIFESDIDAATQTNATSNPKYRAERIASACRPTKIHPRDFDKKLMQVENGDARVSIFLYASSALITMTAFPKITPS